MPSLAPFAASALLGAVGLLTSLPAQAVQLAVAPIRIELYTQYAEQTGSHINLFDKFGEQGVFAIDFGLQSPWWPRGDQLSFGARLTSGLEAAGAGSYTFTLGGDDATYLFIDGALVLSQPGQHSYYQSQATLALAAGLHTMELQFYNGPCCGSALTLDAGGLAFVPSPIPEPATAPLWLSGLAAAGWMLLRRRRPG